jgi:dihydrofolate synthase / folylpolyglutamate synthase
MKTALIIGGGDTDPLFISRIHSRSTILICADHGADSVLEAGLVPDLIVGDMDSIDEVTLHHFHTLGVEVHQDGDEDLLDTEIAILKAIESGADRIIILGAWGDRIDQSLPAFGFLLPDRIPQSVPGQFSLSFSGQVFIVTDHSLISHIAAGGRQTVPTIPGTRVGLIPLPGAENVHTHGLRYELDGIDLSFSETMSVSNIATEECFDVSCNSGDIAVIQWFSDSHYLEHRVRELTGRQQELEDDREYYEVIRALYDHGGKGPTDPEGKAQRLRLTRAFLDALVPGHTDLSIIHIAGTSGKGSTALFLHSILTGAREHPTGLLISPHIHDPNERIIVDGNPIPHRNFVRIWRELIPGVRQLEQEYGVIFLYQELLLLIAIRHFIAEGVEWAVIETGLGGRFDQTRALEADITAITQIDLDHTHILGNTIGDIAYEKAGIIRQTVDLHTSETDPEALRVFGHICDQHGSNLIRCIPEPGSEHVPGRYSLRGQEFTIIQPGEHQIMNAALATSIAMDRVLDIPPDIIRPILLQTRLPGRIEIRGDLIIDTGHNPREIRTLSRTLRELLPVGTGRIVICGMAGRKDHASMLEAVGEMADTVILTKAGYRGEDPTGLRSICRSLPGFGRVGSVITEPYPIRAFRLGKLLQKKYTEASNRITGNEDRCVLIVTGSTFLVDEIFNPDPELRRINSS